MGPQSMSFIVLLCPLFRSSTILTSTYGIIPSVLISSKMVGLAWTVIYSSLHSCCTRNVLTGVVPGNCRLNRSVWRPRLQKNSYKIVLFSLDL